MDFNSTKDNYQAQIENTISFSGKGLDFFTEGKAEYIKEIIHKYASHISFPKILDIGCGHGLIHSYLIKNKYEIIGVEIANEVIPIAQQNNPLVKYLPYNGTDLPFADNSFDVTLAICVMHHVPPAQWLDFTNEMNRVLRPGGIAIIFEHNPVNPLTQYVVRRSPIDSDATLLSATKASQLLRLSNFQRVNKSYIFLTPFVHNFYKALERKVSQRQCRREFQNTGS